MDFPEFRLDRCTQLGGSEPGTGPHCHNALGHECRDPRSFRSNRSCHTDSRR